MLIPPILQIISSRLEGHGAKAILVGGSVRDHFLSLPIKDYDIEVYGLNRLEELEEILQQYGKVKLVGKSFGILKFVYEGKEYDFAFPRIEEKTGRGHKGFRVQIDGALDFATAARRRDFTINAMGYDIAQHLFLDPFGGRKDLQARILRHIDERTFVEDPLRVYRGVQFCARFALTLHPATERLCRRMVEEEMLAELPKERIFEEIRKLLLQAKKPSSGWDLIKRLGILRDFYALATLSPQRWEVTLRRIDMMATLKPEDPKKALVLMLAALTLSCSNEGASETVQMLSDEVHLVQEVTKLVACHEEIDRIYAMSEKDRDAMLRKLATRADIADLILIAKADYWAHHEKEIRYAAGEWIAQRARELGVLHGALPPLLQGRDLISEFGLTPSPKFKDILEKVYMMQLEGKIHSREEAVKFVREKLL